MRHLKKWESKEDLKKCFNFDDFKKCLEFINEIILIADQIDHHPTKIVWEGKSVCVHSFTHDVGKVTKKDHFLMEKISDIFQILIN